MQELADLFRLHTPLQKLADVDPLGFCKKIVQEFSDFLVIDFSSDLEDLKGGIGARDDHKLEVDEAERVELVEVEEIEEKARLLFKVAFRENDQAGKELQGVDEPIE